jgi:hypothetical protein
VLNLNKKEISVEYLRSSAEIVRDILIDYRKWEGKTQRERGCVYNSEVQMDCV